MKFVFLGLSLKSGIGVGKAWPAVACSNVHPLLLACQGLVALIPQPGECLRPGKKT